MEKIKIDWKWVFKPLVWGIAVPAIFFVPVAVIVFFYGNPLELLGYFLPINPVLLFSFFLLIPTALFVWGIATSCYRILSMFGWDRRNSLLITSVVIVVIVTFAILLKEWIIMLYIYTFGLL